MLLDMGTLDLQETQHSIGATTLVVDLAKVFEKVQLMCGLEVGHVFLTFQGCSVGTSLMNKG